MKNNYKDRFIKLFENSRVKHVLFGAFTLVALAVAIGTMWQLHYDVVTLSYDSVESSENLEQMEMESEYLTETYTVDEIELAADTTELETALNDESVVAVAAENETSEEELADTEVYEVSETEGTEAEEDFGVGTEESDETENDIEESGVIYTEQAGNVDVTVTAPEGALPDEAELSVVLYEEDSAEYLAAVEAVGADPEDETTGFAAMDISFRVDGEEVEPAEAVTVSINVSELLDEDDDPSSIQVQHLEEAVGGVTAVLVADASDEAEGSVDEDTAVAEFTVESFSTFTLQWNQRTTSLGGLSIKFTVTCYFRDSDSVDYSTDDSLVPEGISTVTVDGTDITGLILANNNVLVFDNENELLAVEGYTFDYAEITYQGTVYEISSMYGYYTGEDNGVYSYRFIYNLTNGTSITRDYSTSQTNFNPISLYYTAESASTTTELSISDDIANSGHVDAVYTGTAAVDDSYTYTWYYRASADVDWTEAVGQTVSYFNITNAYARYYFYVTLRDGSGNVVATSPVYQVPYYGQIQNGSFENPVQSKTVMQYTNGLYTDLVWHTTGLGSMNSSKATYGQDIEIVSNVTDEAKSTYGWDPYEGNQYAELNCEQYGTLYQDVLTTAGAAMTWQCAHADRTVLGNTTEINDSDMMMVIITDARFADNYLSTQEQIQGFYTKAIQDSAEADIKNASNQTQGFVGPYSVYYEVDLDGDGIKENVTVAVWVVWTGKEATDWTQVADTYVVPDGQYVTRFMFTAVQTRSGDFSSGDLTMGNLIDNISLVQTTGDATLTITKTVSGVSDSTVIPAGSFAFTVVTTDGNYTYTYRVYLPTRDATVTDTSAWQFSLTGLTGGYNCTVTESRDDVDGYTFDSTSSSGDVGTLTLSSGTESTIAYTNSYLPNITLYKTDGTTSTAASGTETIYTLLSGAEFTLLKTEAAVDYYYTYDDVSGTYSWVEYTTGSTAPAITLGQLTIKELENSADIIYTLTEVKTPDGYNTLDPVKFTVENGAIVLATGVDTSLVILDSDGLTLYLTDSPGYELPATGGIGTDVFRYAGVMVIVSLLGICISLRIYWVIQKQKKAGIV